ncbi:hypothetical protein BRD56_06630 [Thermoplasmatales archaeon SW_10_69_26]|nr:MAG: hypothetical protein BRD56_06630 [Thermoplasmatales archaeon SW_10_69_26]
MDAERPAVLVILACLAIAGCLSLGGQDPGQDTSVPQNQTPSNASAPIVNATDYASVSTERAFEPTVAAGPDGTVYVTGARNDLIHVRSPESGEWETRSRPAPPPESRTTVIGDALVSVDDEGRLWYTALLPSQVWQVDDPTRGGVQIAVSEDGGQTWSANHFVGPPEFPWNADRQWTTFGPGGAAHVVWKAYQGTTREQQDAHLVAVTLSEDGSDIGSPVNLTPTFPGSTSLIGGRPATTADGSLVVPYLTVDYSGSSGRDGTMRVARSTDEGSGFTTSVIWNPQNGDAGTNVPISASGDGARVHVAWNGPDGRVLHAMSADRGTTWRTPTPVPGLENQNEREAPWVEVTDGTARVAGFGDPQDGRVLLDLTAFPADEPPSANRSTTVQVAQPPSTDETGFTDFAHLGTLPGGETIAVWGLPPTVGGQINLSTVTVGS